MHSRILLYYSREQTPAAVWNLDLEPEPRDDPTQARNQEASRHANTCTVWGIGGKDIHNVATNSGKLK